MKPVVSSTLLGRDGGFGEQQHARGYGKVGPTWSVIVYKFLVLEETLMPDCHWHQPMTMADSDMGFEASFL